MSDSEKKATKSASSKKGEKFTAEEKAAMKERAKELKASASKAEAENAVLEKLDELPEPERTMAKRLHDIIKENAPALAPKLWYGMPAYAYADGKIVCFFQSATKFNTRYATLGFNDSANLDDGVLWPVAYALKALTDDEAKEIAAIVKKAVS